jgi:hypothetical protein
MIAKTMMAVAAGTLLMGSSPTRPVPIYVHCNAPSKGMAQKACKQLIKNLRGRVQRRSVAPLRNVSDRAGVGLHITFHMISVGDSNLQSFLSWGTAGSQPLSKQSKGQDVTVETASLRNNFVPLIDQLIVLSDIPL